MFQNAVNFLLSYVNQNGGHYDYWYTGITNDPGKRLLQEHNVSKENDLWAYYPCSTSSTARDVEQHFISLGFTGGTGGGDELSSTVYVYRITNHSKE